MLRLAHFSDVHLTAKPLGWHPRDLFSKRVTGWVNVRMLGRGKSFRFAPQVVAALRRDWPGRELDGLVFSGDATGMGFESEFAAASHALGVDDLALPPGVAIPGNHDYYTHRATRRRYFEQYFAPWLTGHRLTADTYPFAKQVGHVWLVCTNSSTVNRWNWDASGKLGDAQLARTRALCESLSPGPRIMVTHYPLRTARGDIEPRVHQLRDHAAALACAKACGIGLWLHGHIHKAFVLPASAEIPFPIVCGGSTTQQNRWGYHEYAIDGYECTMVRRVYELAGDRFVDSETHRFTLGGS